MDRQAVSSSNIRSIGYDAKMNILEVEFINGSIYHYFSVPPNLHTQLMSASSHGTFLNKYIKSGFEYSKIR